MTDTRDRPTGGVRCPAGRRRRPRHPGGKARTPVPEDGTVNLSEAREQSGVDEMLDALDASWSGWSR